MQALGISGRKAAYITDFALRVQSGAFDPETVRESDAEAIRQLCTLKGVGAWTAEMILLFCLQRPDIFSYDDLAIQRGLRMVYHHRQVGRELFEKYRRRYSPLWQRGQSLFVGGGRRCCAGAAGVCAAGKERGEVI